MITMDDIVRDYHPTLREKSEKIEFPLSDDLKKLANEMINFLKNSQDPEMAEKYQLRPGVGIAAPQLDIPKQMLAVHIPSDEEEEEPFSIVMINPRVISHSVKQTALQDGEGCLSIDDVYEGLVPRHKRVTVEYYDLDGNKHKERFKDYPSIVIQHEIDHLNGILFYDWIDEEEPFELSDDLEIFEESL
jgi:peptide deformylase